MRILIVEDEIRLAEVLGEIMKENKYVVDIVNDGEEGYDYAASGIYDVIILDVMLPNMNGFDIVLKLRNNKVKTPIIMLTAKGEELDKILGLELGADDYITKPFSVRELLARVKAVLRRTNTFSESDSEIYKSKSLTVNFERHEVVVNNNKVDLSLKEFELLQILIKNKGKILKREVLLDKIWGYEYIGETRTVDVHIRYLRKKIEEDDKNPRFIETIRGVGYRFNPEE